MRKSRVRSEEIQLRPGESFRVLQWRRNLRDVVDIDSAGSRHAFTGAGHEWHQHAQMELTLIEEGEGTLFIGDAITLFQAPDLVLIGSGLPHYWNMRGASAGIALQFRFGREHPFWRFPESAALRPLWELARRGIRFAAAPRRSLADGLRSLTRSGGGLGRLAGFMRIMELMESAGADQRRTLASAGFAPLEDDGASHGLQRAVNLLFNHYHEDIAPADARRVAGMGKSTFERHFKAYTGKTMTRFLDDVRLNAARRKLLESDLPVGEVATACGYGNISHFHRRFRAAFGCSPLVFRRGATCEKTHHAWEKTQ